MRLFIAHHLPATPMPQRNRSLRLCASHGTVSTGAASYRAGVGRRVVLAASLAALSLAAAGAGSAASQPVTLRIVFPEGFSVRQMADRVAEVRRIAIRKRGVTPRLTGAAYRAAAARALPPAPFRRYLKRRSVEGFLFPALYEFEPRTSAEELISKQLAAFEARWSTVRLGPRARKRTPYDVVSIASMIERETVVPAERKLVAAVIYNRLDKGMPLGIDATLRYGLGIPGTRPLTQAHLRSNSPYNTRRFKGLPPTPIGNPGVPSLRAAANPANVAFLYYLRIPNSVRHFFTADEEEFCLKADEWGYGGC
jgi:UPF0755 protein